MNEWANLGQVVLVGGVPEIRYEPMNPFHTATFKCTIPEMRSAIMSGGDGKQVKFLIPDSEFAESSKLELMKGQLLEVTVRIVPDENKEAADAINEDEPPMGEPDEDLYAGRLK